MAKNTVARKPGARTGVAPKIRALKDRYPEMSELKIAKRVGCSPSNVHVVLSKYLSDMGEDDLRHYQDHKADVFDAIAMRSLLSITPAKLEKASAPALMMVAGTAFDKSQTVKGLATGINVSVLLDVVEAIKQRRAADQESIQRTIQAQVIDAAQDSRA